MAFSGEPLRASVSRTPADNMRTAAKTATTSDRPMMVTAAVSGRRKRLRAL
jgi:hypothetical protein